MFVNYPIAGNLTIAGCHLGTKYHYFVFTESALEPESSLHSESNAINALDNNLPAGLNAAEALNHLVNGTLAAGCNVGDLVQAARAIIDPNDSLVDEDGKLFLQLLILYTFISHRDHD